MIIVRNLSLPDNFKEEMIKIVQEFEITNKNMVVVTNLYQILNKNFEYNSWEKRLNLYNEIYSLSIKQWNKLSDYGKVLLLSHLYYFVHYGCTTQCHQQTIYCWHKVNELSISEWNQLNPEGKRLVLKNLTLNSIFTKNLTQLSPQWQQVINLGIPEWYNLCFSGKNDALICLYNLGIINPSQLKKLQYFHKIINLGIPYYQDRHNFHKTILESTFSLSLITGQNSIQRLKFLQHYIFLILSMTYKDKKNAYLYCTNNKDRIKMALHNTMHHTTPQMHYLSAISYAEYLLMELPITKIDWLLSPTLTLHKLEPDGNSVRCIDFRMDSSTPQSLHKFLDVASVFSTLAEALLVHKLTLPTSIIQQLQYKTNDIEALVGNYSRYLVDNQQWHHPVVGDFGTLTLALIASHCPDRLLSLYRHHIDFKESEFFDEEQLESHKQSFYDDIDWNDIKQLLITEQHRNNPKKSIETLFAGYDHYKLTFMGDCRNHTTDDHKVFAKQQYIEKWDAGEVPALVFEVLQFIPTDNINKIIDFYKKFGVNCSDDEVILQTILSAWLLNNVSKPFNEHILTYIQSNLKKVYDCEHLPESYNPWHTNDKIEHWSEYLFGLLPIPKNNLILLNVLRHCQQMQLPQWLKNSQQGEQFYIEKIWRALEVSRFGLNLQFVLPNKTMVKIFDEDKEAIKDALIFQMAEITGYFYDNQTQDNINFYAQNHSLVDPYLVLKNLAKAFEKSNVNLQIPSIVECQNHLEYGDFIVQIWQDDTTINQINLLIVDIHHQVITTTNHHLDSNIWQNISPETDLGIIEHINSSVIKFLEELLNILKNINETVKKIYILPMDKLAILPWQYCWEKTSHKQNKKINSNNIGIEIISTICSWIKTKQINQLIKESSVFLNKQIIQDLEEYDISPDLPNLEFHSSQLLLKGRLSSINNNPLWLLQGLSEPMYHHIISHAIFNKEKPEYSHFQYQKSNLFAWKISCGQMAGEVNLTACEALSIGSKSNHLMNELYFGPMGVGASIHAAGAQVVRGNIWLIEFLPSYLFNHHWYTHREKYDTHTSLILTQNTLRELTKKDIIDFLISQKEEIDDQMTKMSLERTISEFEYLSKNTDNETRPFSHPFFWQGYCVLGFHEPSKTNKKHFGGIFARVLMRVKEILLYLYRER